MFIRKFTLKSYQSILDKLGSVILHTYSYAIIAIIIIVALGVFIAYLSTRRKNPATNLIDTLTMFPYIIPGSVLGITLLLAFNKAPLLLSGTPVIIIIAFVVRRLPYTLRSSAAILYQISPSMDEASISLGCSPVKTFFKVTLIMMLPGVFSGAILSWVTVINELSSSVILYTGRTRTMSVAIYTEVIRASYGTAAALSTILTLTTVASLLIFFKVSGSKEISL
jgi:iron(III) transport system permease protein